MFYKVASETIYEKGGEVKRGRGKKGEKELEEKNGFDKK